MPGRICPWWLGYLLISPLRRLGQDPQKILRPFLEEGMRVLEPGCGMGYFTLEMARLVGTRGQVVAVDLQPRMIRTLMRRARKAGLNDRIDARIADGRGLQIDDLVGVIDFALVFAVVHELPDEAYFFEQLYRALKPGAKILMAEPKAHVKERKFAASSEMAQNLGFRVAARPLIRGNWTLILEHC